MDFPCSPKEQPPDLRISDCSSDEENTLFSRHNLSKSSDTAALDITWSSDDELSTKNFQSFINTSCFDNGAATPLSRRYSRSARKSKLPNVGIKRKLSKVIGKQGQVRTTLGNRNIPLHNNSINSSPWCKVRKTFSILRCQSSIPESCLPTEQQQKTPTKNCLSQYDSVETSIDWSSSSSETGSPTRTPKKAISETQKSTAPTELELLVALIERENPAAKVKAHPTAFNQKKKRYVQGGYAERLQKLEEANRIERNFLRNDQQLGLQNGTHMCVLELNKAYGVHIATVKLEQCYENAINWDSSANVRIIIDADTAAHVKIGSRIEAFFDATIAPYTLKTVGGETKEIIYVQPHKLLLL
uniref:Uncharacterized protein n=1 Tax=Bactrocera latifrons TaxID=174628 RepID=A0A0K8VKE6_BACLA